MTKDKTRGYFKTIHRRTAKCLQPCQHEVSHKTDRQAQTIIKSYSPQAVNSLWETIKGVIDFCRSLCYRHLILLEIKCLHWEIRPFGSSIFLQGWGYISYILSRATYHRAPRYGGVRRWVEGLLAHGTAHWLAHARVTRHLALGECRQGTKVLWALKG